MEQIISLLTTNDAFDSVCEHLSTSLEVDVDLVKEAFSSYEVPKPKKTPVAKATTKAKSAKGAKSETHTCEYVKQSGELCDKNAKNEHNDSWYCGTEKSGHYKSMLTKDNDADVDTEVEEKPAKSTKSKVTKSVATPSKAAKTSTKETPKGKAKEAPKAAKGTKAAPKAAKGTKTAPKADDKAKKVIRKVVKQDVLAMERATTADGEEVWVYPHNNIVVDEDKIAYAHLSDDGVLTPLEDEHTKFLDLHNIEWTEAQFEDGEVDEEDNEVEEDAEEDGEVEVEEDGEEEDVEEVEEEEVEDE